MTLEIVLSHAPEFGFPRRALFLNHIVTVPLILVNLKHLTRRNLPANKPRAACRDATAMR
jgi:hypothetical protein